MTLDYLQDKVLKCRATGNPAPTITWEKDGVRIDDGEKFDIKTKHEYEILLLVYFDVL